MLEELLNSAIVWCAW